MKYPREGEYDSALIYFDKTLEESPYNTEILFRKGVVLERQERYTEAIRIFSDVISYSDKPFASSYSSRAEAKIKMEDYYEAIDYYENAIKLDNTNCYNLFKKAEIYYINLKNYEKASAELKRFNLISEDCIGYIDIKLLEAKTYLMLNNPIKAILTIDVLIDYYNENEYLFVKNKPEILSVRTQLLH